MKHPTDFAGDATVAIILAAASTEGFINELADAVRVEREQPQLYPVSPQLIAFADAHEQLEDPKKGRKGSTAGKYLDASEKLSGAKFPKGTEPYQAFAKLMRLRDLHMHLRSRDSDGAIENGSYEEPSITITSPEGRIAFIKSLMQMGLTRECNDEANIGTSWLNLLQTAKMANWACFAALNIIRAVLDMIPNRLSDTASMFKNDFRRRTDDWIQNSPPSP